MSETQVLKERPKAKEKTERDIVVTYKVWRILHEIKLKEGYRRINDVIEDLLKKAGYQV
jgi:hypothetical protein